MKIGGFQKFSLIEYPGRICATIFTRGCNFRCCYCHNPELVLPKQYAPQIPLNGIFDFLETRRGKLDAVSITGGEPTNQTDLIEVMKRIKEMGFLVKLDSNGSHPEIIKSAIDQHLVDYLAIDVKAPFEDYSKIAGRKVPGERLQQTIRLVMDSGVEYEFRTTVVKSLINIEDLIKIAKSIQGAKKYFLQKFLSSKLIDERYNNETTYSDEELNQFTQILMQYVMFCGVR